MSPSDHHRLGRRTANRPMLVLLGMLGTFALSAPVLGQTAIPGQSTRPKATTPKATPPSSKMAASRFAPDQDTIRELRMIG
ncbi:MAG: hypothetical protein QMB94_06360, partial [Phycisphaerales bacterium]